MIIRISKIIEVKDSCPYDFIFMDLYKRISFLYIILEEFKLL
jgi:hypothetical protein